MGFIRNLLALIGLIVILAAGWAYTKLAPALAGAPIQLSQVPALWDGFQKIAPKLKEFDPEFPKIYAEFLGKLAETGDPGVSMMWAEPVKEGLTPEEVVESLKSLATARNFLFVGESPFYKQIKAITGEDYRYVNFLSFCDARVGKAMLEYRDQYSGFMPCRIALVQEKSGRLWLYTMNLDLMIHGGKKLPDNLRADALRVRTIIKEMMEGAAKGDF